MILENFRRGMTFGRMTLWRYWPLAIAAAVCAFGSIGCGQDFAPSSRVTSLRVLAVSADQQWDAKSAPKGQAYAAPGEHVFLQAEWSAPADDHRVKNWVWAYCVDPDSTTVSGCIASIGKEAQKDPSHVIRNVTIPTPDRDVFDFVVPSDALSRLPSDSRTNATVGVLTIVCPGTLKLADLTTIQQGTIPLQCLEEGTGRALGLDEYVVGIKRIFVRQTDRNENPKVAKVTFDGNDWGEKDVKQVGFCDTDGERYDRCADGDKHQIALVLDPSSYEKGTDENGTAFTEQLIVQYYSTEGIFEHEVKTGQQPTTGWVARKAASGKDLKMWLLARDNRGGVVWVERTVHVN